MTAPLLEVRDLKTHFPVRRGAWGRVRAHAKAVDGVSLEIRRGETLGLVGESGSGKSTLARTLLRLVEPTAGSIQFDGQELVGLAEASLRPLRRRMQLVFQDPYASLDPRMTVRDIVAEGLAIHRVARAERQPRVFALLDRMGLPREAADRHPHEFSAGQRQRIGIARALALSPDLVVADEPVSALDASVRAQIVNLLVELQQEMGLAYLFIAHDLNVVRYVSDRVAVMYLGKIVEHASADDLYRRPRHPYTQALLAAVPIPDPARRRAPIAVAGDVPSLVDPPAGCPFHPRCPRAFARCRVEAPPMYDVGGGHGAACFLAEEPVAK